VGLLGEHDGDNIGKAVGPNWAKRRESATPECSQWPADRD
jgi:hypothetical protein